jgi:hypothetical protein
VAIWKVARRPADGGVAPLRFVEAPSREAALEVAREHLGPWSYLPPTLVRSPATLASLAPAPVPPVYKLVPPGPPAEPLGRLWVARAGGAVWVVECLTRRGAARALGEWLGRKPTSVTGFKVGQGQKSRLKCVAQEGPVRFWVLTSRKPS